MNFDWRSILLPRLLLLATVAGVLGLLTGFYAWSLVLVMTGYLLWNLRQLVRLFVWLKRADPNELPPESNGLWGEVLDEIYRMQRRNERQRASRQAVIDRTQESTAALRDAVVMLDTQGNLEWWNRAAGKLLGFKRGQDEGQPLINLVRDPRFKDYFDQHNYNEPLELVSPLDDRVRLQFQLTLFGQGEHLMLVRDVTRVHQLEQMRKDFVANVSHELRTPLTVIAGYLETLLDNADGIPPRWKRALGQMHQQSSRMENLLNDLLLLARLEASDYPADNKPVDVADLLETIQNDAIELSGPQGHQIQLQAEAVGLKGCEAELRSAFSNLVFNAVKYSPDGGRIDMHWWRDEQGVHLSVRDTGIGIDPRHIPRLTERFYRVDASRSISTGGTGLGLAIVKHVLHRHRGRLEISSVPGKGSCFTCHFPPAQIASNVPMVD